VDDLGERSEIGDAAVTFPRASFAGATLALGLIGGVVAAYGTILIGIAHHFALPVTTAGITLSVNFAGAVVGVLVCWWVMGRFAGDRVLTAALSVLALGLALAACAPSWEAFLAAVFLGGIGFGAVDFAVVTLVSRIGFRDRASRLSVSGAGWGFGAVAGPLFILLVHPDRYQVFLAVAATVGLALIALTRTVRAPVPRQLGAFGRSHAPRAVLLVFVAALGSYVALETATAGWLATQLHGWGYAAVVGTAVTAGFWAGLAVGRLGAGHLAARWSGQRLIVVGLATSIALLLGASDRALAPVLYPLVGFAIAAVFPLGLHWFTELSPNDHNGVGWLIVVDMVAGVVGSGAQYVAVSVAGLEAVPFVAAGFAAVCLALFVGALRFPLPTSGGPGRS
jgi:MFS transporter, FHS family, glucose/mannose:H+ symporter